MKNYKKELQLKGNSVKRLIKEYQSYQKEVDKFQAKLDEMTAQGADEYDVNKQKEFMEESVSTRDGVKTKLRNWTDELINLINEIEDEETKNLEEYATANDILNTAKLMFENLSE